MSERRLPGAPWRWALAAAAVVLVLGALLLWLPWLREPRAFVAATPAPAPTSPLAYTPVALRRGAVLCMAPVTLPADGRVVQLLATTPLAAQPRLELSLRGAGGFRTEAMLSDRSGGQALLFDVDPPPRDLGDARLCVMNASRTTIELVGSTEVFTAGARPQSSIDGTKIVPKVALTLYTGDTRGAIHRATAVFGHAAAFKPFGGLVLGLAALLLLIALPLATIGGFAWTLRDEQGDTGRADGHG